MKRLPIIAVISLMSMLILCVSVNAQLSANFTSDITSGCAPVVVKFQDLSTGNPNSWRWDLGNGTQSFQQHPTGTYFNPGTYNVKLVIRNAANNSDSITKTAFITVRDVPTVQFTASETNGCFPKTVQFTDQSTPGSGTITEWQWDFGDGNLSTQQSPSHTYLSGGTFTVTLRVKNSFGCQKVLSKPGYIQLQNSIDANFTLQTNTSCNPPVTVNFTNTSTGSGTLTYQWDFGDGTFSTQTNPIHSYGATGTYTIKLKAWNSSGCVDSFVAANAVSVGSVAANYNAPVQICEGTSYTIANTSSPTPSGAFWDFGDGTISTNINPVKSWTNAGSYDVKLVSDFGACRDSITKTVVVNAKPTAAFNQSGGFSQCNPPVNVNFTNTSAGAVSYQWLFGDGGTSTQTNPSHIYTTVGSFNVSLIATNGNGCTDTLTKPALVRIGPPKITGFNGIPFKGCAPYTVTVKGNIDSPEPIISWKWYFGDGGTSTDSIATHHYPNSGTYNITLVVTSQSGCKDSVVYTEAVIISAKPNVNFTASPLVACAKDDITFTDLTTGNVTEWLWSFGDGSTSDLQHPVHNYSDTGQFTVTLIVRNLHCTDSITKVNLITILPPIALFEVSISCDTPMQRRFIDRSIDAASYSWQFGDGGTSTSSNPVHVYSSPGRYIVELTVANGPCTHTMKDTIDVINENPSFSLSDTVFCKNTNITFTATNYDTSKISSFTWLFGDGFAAQTSSPQILHSYSVAGNYTPALIATNSLGCADTTFQSISVDIFGPTAGFSNPPGTCIDGTIPFTDTSKTDGLHNIVEWKWNFGDNQSQTYTAAPFQHQYTASGTYDVMLRVKDSYGCYDSIVTPMAVIITDPVADFTIDDTIKCRNSTAQFASTSNGLDLTYSWLFGDGGSSTAASPTHVYTSYGRFTVSLAIADRFGCTDTSIKVNIIEVADPKAIFNISDTFASCPPFLINLVNQSLHYTNVLWDFGDGSTSTLDTPSHYYTDPATYILKLYAFGHGNCVDTLVKPIVLKGPSGSFTYSPKDICSSQGINFRAYTKNNATFIWDFSDGIIVNSPDSIITHPYDIPGLYRPKMILVDSAGCQVPITGEDTIRVVGVEAEIGIDQRTFCDSTTTMFRDSSFIQHDTSVSYLWRFDDGTISTQRNPLHSYNQTGIYNVSFTVTTTLGCVDSVVMNPGVKIVSSPLIGINNQSSICVQSPLSFTGEILRPDTSALQWNWNFGNGNSSTQQNPSYTYTSAGNYTITSIAINSSGCKDTATSSVLVHPLPNVTAGPDTTICRGQTHTLQPGGAATYMWTNHPSLSCANCTNPWARPDTTMQYMVTGTSSFGCEAKDSVVVKVLQPFNVQVSNADTLCEGESVRLIVSGADSYTWTPVTGLNNPNASNPIASPTQTTTYTVVGKDNRNCFADTGRITVTVYPIPKFDIVEATLRISSGSSAQIKTTSSADITHWKWTPSTGLSCTGCPQPITSARENTTYTVQVWNDGGCATNDKVEVIVTCEGGNVFIPNTFSPNGDGMNDVFYVRSKGISEVRSVKVFNRWGELVFKTENKNPNDPTAGWNGTYKNSKPTPGVYVYIVDVVCDNNTVFTLKGDVTLIQ